MDTPIKPKSLRPIAGVIRLNWLNDDTLVFLDEQKVMALSVKTRELKVLAEECSDLLSVFDNTMLFYRDDNRNQRQFFFYKNGVESPIHLPGEENVNQCILINGALFYTPYNSNNQKNEVIALDLKTNERHTLTEGVIIGSSPERNKLYFVNRYEYFTYIP